MKPTSSPGARTFLSAAISDVHCPQILSNHARGPGLLRTGMSALRAFTLLETVVVIATLLLLAVAFAPVLTRTRPNAQAWQCINNAHRLANAWKMYADDFNDVLVAGQEGTTGRPAWITGTTANTSPTTSPLFKYTGNLTNAFKCPADESTYLRSVSMNNALGTGDWLNGQLGTGPGPWRLYSRGVEIVRPAQTFVFTDEHCGSINDGSLGLTCTGNQPSDPPSSSRIIDFPGSYHSGACTFSFADGRVEIHRWVGTTVQPSPNSYIPNLNVLAMDSWLDMHWLAANATVSR